MRKTLLIALLLASAGSIPFLVGDRDGARTDPDGVRSGREPEKKPSDWFYAQRAFPNELIPEGAYRRALAQARALRDARGADLGADAGAANKSAVLPPAWSAAGPSNIGGRVTAVGSHTSLPSTVYIGAAAGGVWKSTNSGATWAPIFDGVGSPSIGALTVAPWSATSIFVGTGEANAAGDTYDGDGVYVSYDGGGAWYSLGLAQTRRIGRIALDPTDPNRIYVAAAGTLFSKDGNRGVYRTTNAGFTWERTLFVSDSTSAIDVVLQPGNPAIVYAAMWERIRRPYQRQVGGVTSGIYKSTDFGETWTLLTNGLPPAGPTVGRIGLSASVSAPGTLVAIYCDHPGNFMGLYRTTDGGASWARMNDGALAGMYGGFGWYFGNVRIDPTNANKIYALGQSFYRTTNGGTNWTNIVGGSHVDYHDLWIDPATPARVYQGSDGGFYSSTNSGSAWTMFVDLPITQFYAVTIDPSIPARLYGGAQDNSTSRTLTGALNDWTVIYGGDGFYCLVDPTDSDVIYAEYQYGGIGKSTDGGFGFDDATNGINSGDRTNWSTPIVMSPQDPQTLYMGTFRIYRTTNGAANWTAISPDLTEGPSPANLVFGTVTTIAAAPSNATVLYAGTDDGHVWVTQNLGGNWTDVTGVLPDRWVTRVAVDPTDDAVAYATISGYKNDETQPHVFRTTDHGALWSDISANLPDSPLNAIVVDPIDNGADPTPLYVGSDVGVYASYDLGANWTPLGNGMPDVVVGDLVLHAASRTLLAGTHGRSTYTVTLPASPTGVSPPAAPEEALAASVVRLGAPTPNPARDGVRLEFSLGRAADVSAAVYDLSGRLVRSLERRALPAGAHALSWDRRDDRGARAAAGAYVLRIDAAGQSATRKLILVD